MQLPLFASFLSFLRIIVYSFLALGIAKKNWKFPKVDTLIISAEMHFVNTYFVFFFQNGNTFYNFIIFY